MIGCTGHHFASKLTDFGRGQGLKLQEIPFAEVARIYQEQAKAKLPLSEQEFREVISAEYNIPDQLMYEHAWRYFDLHAKQRIAVFNFFLALSALVAAGLAACIQSAGIFLFVGAVLGTLLAIVSFIFWKLDQRVSFLIKRSENAIGKFESSFIPNDYHLFDTEDADTNAKISTSSRWSKQWTYGECFRFVFTVMAAVGISGAIFSMSRYVCLVS